MSPSAPVIPRLEGQARAAVDHRGGHLQIIASAGSGKTEVVSQRVAALCSEGVAPEAIVAFTFTERAAASLKARIERCILADQSLGEPFLDRLGAMFVGTIHAYCFALLQQHVPRYETFDLLDDNRLTAFLTREAYAIGIPELCERRLFRSIRVFLDNLEVIENELLEPSQLEEPFRGIYERYLEALQESRLLTFGQVIAQAVRELQRPEVYAAARATLRHLIVDEYQDVNPAQEALIARLAADPVQLCVVGDDDQAIYQWRGSTVDNIVHFATRYPAVTSFRIQTNRRSRPAIIEHANRLGALIEGRKEKTMEPHRPASEAAEVAYWSQETPQDEARVIAEAVRRAHDELGHRYRDVAILCRGRVSLPPIHDALQALAIPVKPGSRTDLFLQPEADLFGRLVCFLAGRGWQKEEYGPEEEVTLDDLVERLTNLFVLNPAHTDAVRLRLHEWRLRTDDESKPANLVREWYELLDDLGVWGWDLAEPWAASRMGTLARCSQVLSDYEAARRRSRPDRDAPGEQRGASDRGVRYYSWLATYVQHWAQGAYEGFEGEEAIDFDAVELTTIHQAKGLEWPLVFVPALTSRRFPSSKTGQAGDWRVPAHLFDAARYEGCLNDERRLFYVAMTRAREFLSLSSFDALKRSQRPSPFLLEVTGGLIPPLEELPAPPPPQPVAEAEEILEISFSDLAFFCECGLAYRLRTLLGFQPTLVPELGYGRAVHHLLREVAEHVRHWGKRPTPRQLDQLFDESFYLPAAGKAAHREMKASARRLVDRYLESYEEDLQRVWAVEQPFELHLGGATVAGRADVIIDETDGRERLTIVDYKTAADGHDQHDFQLQVYTAAGRREGLTIDRALVHDLRASERFEVPVSSTDITGAESQVRDLVAQIRARLFHPAPRKDRCGRCDVKPLCAARAS
jgi:DNA helicase-2/ATP-dependent DNA helicase PcrA